ncbi:flavin-containing monooxygenase [Sporobolomyces koalae]|uniref:flavin-containing monooxygenase n=1 Tax=Sporobolomyces koalae TaxID=500713 RepID=UPI00317A5920
MSETPPLKSHHEVVIAGAGISGLTALIQLKRQLNVSDIRVYEKGADLGGTWATNVYPGARCDIPVALYSFSFSPAKEFPTQWPSSTSLLSYYHRVTAKYAVSHLITYKTLIQSATFSRSTGLWTLEILDLASDSIRIETCNVFIAAVGALSVPADPPFDTKDFKGRVMHTAKWDEQVSLKDKNVVVLGNGCSAAQLVPAILDQVKSVTQIARSPHAIVPPNKVPDTAFVNSLIRWIPGLFSLVRFAVFYLCESYFWMNDDTVQAKRGRDNVKQASDRYIEKTAPKKYWDSLKFDFEFGQKRRIIDFAGYTRSLHSPKFTLIQPSTIVSASDHSLSLSSGQTLDGIDVLVLSIGFKVTDYLFPLEIKNDRGESLKDRFKSNGVRTYMTSMVESFPNFFILMGPNSVTGHSSVLFNTECTVNMMVNLLNPVFKSLKRNPSTLDNRSRVSSASSPSISPSKPERSNSVKSMVSFEVSNLLESQFDQNESRYPVLVSNTNDSASSYHSQRRASGILFSDLEFAYEGSRVENPASSRKVKPQRGTRIGAAPTVEVTLEAELEWFEALRTEMKNKIWEKQPNLSWYTDKEQGGKCTTLYPWSQWHFKRSTETIVRDRFVWTHC